MNPIPVDAHRLPNTALRCAEQQNLVFNHTVMMDALPLNGGVCIFNIDKVPVLIGQRDWFRVYHVWAEPDWSLLDMVNGHDFDEWLAQQQRWLHTLITNKAYSPAKQHHIQTSNAVDILMEYRSILAGGEVGFSETTFTILKLLDEMNKGVEP